MIVYCDTSFLVSLLYEGDAHHKSARDLVERFDGQDFVLCQAHQLELPASVRAATHRTESPIPAHVARTIINRFDRAWNGRTFARRDLALDDSVTMARSLGEAHGWSKRHTSFDLWHLAAAWTLGAGAFLTLLFIRRVVGLVHLPGFPEPDYASFGGPPLEAMRTHARDNYKHWS